MFWCKCKKEYEPKYGDKIKIICGFWRGRTGKLMNYRPALREYDIEIDGSWKTAYLHKSLFIVTNKGDK